MTVGGQFTQVLSLLVAFAGVRNTPVIHCWHKVHLKIGGEEQADCPSSSRQVVIESDLYTPRPLELLPHRSDRRDGEGRRSGRLHGARQQGPHLAKAPARPGMCVLDRVPRISLGGNDALRPAATVSVAWLAFCPITSRSSLASSITPGERSTCGVGRALPPPPPPPPPPPGLARYVPALNAPALGPHLQLQHKTPST